MEFRERRMKIEMERKHGALRRQSGWKGARTNGKAERKKKEEQ